MANREKCTASLRVPAQQHFLTNAKPRRSVTFALVFPRFGGVVLLDSVLANR
jgi:hypothetical protein